MSKVRRIIEAYIKNTYPEDMRKKFALWLKNGQDRQEKDEILMELWNELDVEADRSTEKSFNELQAKISARTIMRNRQTGKKHISFINKLLRISAMLLLPLLSAIFTYFYLKNDHPVANDMQLVEYIVPNGDTKDIVLPDSSKVQLNAGSILVYPQHFGKTRTVYLNGEAYFSVSRNDKQPFIVNTTDMDVEVVGTVFNISSYADSENSSATLENGIVNVRLKNAGNQTITLVPNERISYNRNSGLVEKQTVKVDNIIAWTKGKIAIQSMSIDEIAKIIKRKYGMDVYLNSHRYKNERITMKLNDDENIEEFMNILRHLVPDLRYKIENNSLYIY